MRVSLRTRGLVLGAVAVVLWLGSPEAALAKGYMTPGFRNKQTRPMNLIVIPPHADFIKAKAIMTDQMVKETQALEIEGARAIVSDLNALGYKARALTVAEIQDSPGLAELVRKINDRYDEEWRKIVRRPRAVREGRYNVGDDVSRLSAFVEGDGVAIARIQAVGSTGGRIAIAVLIGGGAPSYARLDLSVIEARHGRVECYVAGMRGASLKQLTTKADEVMTRTSRTTMKKYPEAAKVWNVMEEDLAAEADEEGDEDAVIGDFEALLGPEEQKPPEGDKPPEGEKPPN